MGRKIVEKPDKGDDGSEDNLQKAAKKSAAENKDESDSNLSSAFQEFMKTRLQYSKWVRTNLQTRYSKGIPKNFPKLFLGKKIEKASEQVENRKEAP